jgi:hypothetical protein
MFAANLCLLLLLLLLLPTAIVNHNFENNNNNNNNDDDGNDHERSFVCLPFLTQVHVRRTVTQPTYGWGNVKQTTVGLLRAVRANGEAEVMP